MKALNNQIKEARLRIAQAGFGDLLKLNCSAGTRQPMVSICIKPELLKALDDDLIMKCLAAASSAGALLESYGWEVSY